MLKINIIDDQMTNNNPITISLLKNNPECIPDLANIWRDVLGKIWLPDVPINKTIDNLKSHLNIDSLPLTYVAFEGKSPVGMCSLRENDGIRSDLMPWLGSLVVSAAHQNKGIGTKLIKVTIERAKEMGYSKLYLFAFDPTIPEYYSRLGWFVIGTDKFKGHHVTVMRIDICDGK